MDITAQELKERMEQGNVPPLVDVREPHEWDMGHLEGAIHLPLGEIAERMGELEQFKDQELVMYCRSGGRSGSATAYLAQQGFANVRNLTGGMLGWKDNIDPDFNVI